ncbi:uncharacterized protein SPPG_04474 [Spizellomyces punctatus DAOM BR117]|uniref:ACB domain-containing protein n=1 Tax=Spizellomyces punctatus (strain DAOM BR117) TaxID=645134 RepID=A0A0L0HGI6_SPIPD|nr:uncharacterized protein SPPG_04474 [Spizellomyces punctatus DAOM BR117]KND00132.1 hypothetical protein SPPG_04474 [Spizellomyces punctatus DAOM BR117]|eukprot:XP_016608171.1 hypothetical protein SPPG_04474 [Spizellomyces punctatus DAOM BR117]
MSRWRSFASHPKVFQRPLASPTTTSLRLSEVPAASGSITVASALWSIMEERFLRAVTLISAAPKEQLPHVAPISNAKKLELYAFYKQATLGKCNIPTRPGWFDIAGRYKWDAWNRLGDMPKEEAMQHYLEEALPILQQFADLPEAQVDAYIKRHVQPGDRQEVETLFQETRRFVQEMSYSDEEDRFSFEDVQGHSHRSKRATPKDSPSSPTLIPRDVPSIPEPDTPPLLAEVLPSPSTPPIPPPPDIAVALAEEVLTNAGELRDHFALQQQRMSPEATQRLNEDVVALLDAVMQRLDRVERRLMVLEQQDGKGDTKSKRSNNGRGTSTLVMYTLVAAPIFAFGIWHGVKTRRK